MAWYKKYLSAYEKPFREVPEEVIREIKSNINKLQSNTPLVSVVIIAHNEEKRLLANLWSLSDSICKYPMEIIGVDNNSSDATAEIYKITGVPYYTEHDKGPGYARRCGLNHARGKYYLCIDSDTMYPPKYVETMVKSFDKPNTVAVSSLWSYIPDKQHSWLSVKLYESLRDIYLFLQSIKRPELCVRGLVFAHDTELSRQIGYRVDIKRGEDGSMALGLKKYGKIRFIHTHKARPVTGYGTVGADGSFFNSFKVRAIKALKNIRHLFIKQKEYKDEESNLIK
jgi:hypothetical protein